MSTEFLCSSFKQDLSSLGPLVPIQILGHNGHAYIDTGAKSSVAGAQLTQLLLKDKAPYTVANEMKITLADGVQRKVKVFIFNLSITLYDKIIPITLLSVPEHENSRTLLGVDFIRNANLILDIPDHSYYFTEYPEIRYSFIAENVSLFLANACQSSKGSNCVKNWISYSKMAQ